MPKLTAPDGHDEQSGGVTIAVAMLLRVQGQTPTQLDVEQWVKKIDAAMAPVFGVDANTSVGITIRVTEQNGKRVAKDLILDAAEDCPTYFRRSRDEAPTRTVDHRRTTPIWTAAILGGLLLLVKMFKRS